MSGSNFNKFTYAYDTRDVRTSVQQKYAFEPLRQVDYTYDAVDQLVGEAATGGVAGTTYSNAYSYDAMGNRLKRENTQNTTTALTRSSVNALNQLTSVSTSIDGGPRVTGGMNYDAAGNLTETSSADGSRTLYVYDDADRLFRIEKRDAADAPVSKSEFIYDYASRKAVSQEFTYTAGAWVQSSEKRRVFDGLDVIQERDELNQVTAQLVRDGNIGGILSRSTAVGASFFGYDGGGNVTLLTDANGNEVGRYRYDAFGNTLETTGGRAAENPYRFSTKELHGASGLYDFGYRFYSASLGRWINRDPLREDGGINLYAMVGNDPVNKWDEYGEQIMIAVTPPWMGTAVGVGSRVGTLANPNYGALPRLTIPRVSIPRVSTPRVSVPIPRSIPIPGDRGFIGPVVNRTQKRNKPDTRPRDENGDLYRTAPRHRHGNGKDAYEAAKKSCGRGEEPELDKGNKGKGIDPHYHPVRNGRRLPDHHYFPRNKPGANRGIRPTQR